MESLEKIFNKIWDEKKVPEEWKTGIIKPLFKKGNKEEAKSYKVLIMMDTGYRIYANIVEKKIRKELEVRKILERNTNGF